jgi:hypothetical protein
VQAGGKVVVVVVVGVVVEVVVAVVVVVEVVTLVVGAAVEVVAGAVVVVGAVVVTDQGDASPPQLLARRVIASRIRAGVPRRVMRNPPLEEATRAGGRLVCRPGSARRRSCRRGSFGAMWREVPWDPSRA